MSAFTAFFLKSAYKLSLTNIIDNVYSWSAIRECKLVEKTAKGLKGVDSYEVVKAVHNIRKSNNYSFLFRDEAGRKIVDALIAQAKDNAINGKQFLNSIKALSYTKLSSLQTLSEKLDGVSRAFGGLKNTPINSIAALGNAAFIARNSNKVLGIMSLIPDSGRGKAAQAILSSCRVGTVFNSSFLINRKATANILQHIPAQFRADALIAISTSPQGAEVIKHSSFLTTVSNGNVMALGKLIGANKATFDAIVENKSSVQQFLKTSARGNTETGIDMLLAADPESIRLFAKSFNVLKDAKPDLLLCTRIIKSKNLDLISDNAKGLNNLLKGMTSEQKNYVITALADATPQVAAQMLSRDGIKALKTEMAEINGTDKRAEHLAEVANGTKAITAKELTATQLQANGTNLFHVGTSWAAKVTTGARATTSKAVSEAVTRSSNRAGQGLEDMLARLFPEKVKAAAHAAGMNGGGRGTP